MKEISIQDLNLESDELEFIGLCELPESVQKLYQEALAKDEEQLYEEVVHKCEIIMNKYPGFTDGMYLLGRAYVQTNQPQQAKEIFEQLVKVEPDNHYAVAYLATAITCLGEYKRAIKLFKSVYPLEQYAQWLNICYGTALEQTRDVVTTRKVYLDMIKAFFDGVETDLVVVNSAFFHLFKIDEQLDYKSVEADTDLYIRFIYLLTDIDKEYQKEILATVIAFSRTLKKRHMRKSFVKLLENLSENILFANQEARDTIASGYCAWESYELEENSKVDYFTSRLMNSYFEAVFSNNEEKKKEIPIYKLFILRKLPEIFKQFDIMEKEYPYTWNLFKDIVEEIKNNSKEVLNEKYEKEYAATHPGKAKKVLREDINELYAQVVQDEEEHLGKKKDHIRFKKKIGRNDLCPCGSGLKYKNCCGNR